MDGKLTLETLNKIELFLKGKLSSNENRIFEKQLKNNIKLQEEVFIQKHLLSILSNNEWMRLKNSKDNKELQDLIEKYRSKQFQTASKNIKDIGLNHIKNKKDKKFYILGYVACAVLLFFFGITYFTNIRSPLGDQYYSHSDWKNELISFTEKGNTNDIFVNAEQSFKNKNYIHSITLFKTINKTDERYAYSLMYLGAAYDLINKNEKALQTFDLLLLEKESNEFSRGYWYKSLIYLELNNKEKTIEYLKLIITNPNNHNYDKAKKLLKEVL